jgi:threonine dehydratase
VGEAPLSWIQYHPSLSCHEHKHRPLPTYDDVVAAAQRLQGVAHRTPVLTSRTMDEQLGARLFFKCENLQRIGAFKFRGAYNALAQFTPEQRKGGALAFSSGNHAQAIAQAAQLLDMPALIVMPEDAPASKMAATRGYGAQVVTYNRFTEDREAIADKLATERGMTLIPPYNHRDVIAGQGTAVKELLEEVPDLDYLFVCLGGGGLLARQRAGRHALAPQCKVIGVEPKPATTAAVAARRPYRGDRLRRAPSPTAPRPRRGQSDLAIIQQRVNEVLTVNDEQLVQAMRFYAERMNRGRTHGRARQPPSTAVLALKGKRAGIVDQWRQCGTSCFASPPSE